MKRLWKEHFARWDDVYSFILVTGTITLMLYAIPVMRAIIRYLGS